MSLELLKEWGVLFTFLDNSQNRMKRRFGVGLWAGLISTNHDPSSKQNQPQRWARFFLRPSRVEQTQPGWLSGRRDDECNVVPLSFLLGPIPSTDPSLSFSCDLFCQPFYWVTGTRLRTLSVSLSLFWLSFLWPHLVSGHHATNGNNAERTPVRYAMQWMESIGDKIVQINIW